MSWGKAMWRLYKFFVGVSTAVIVAIIIFWTMTLTCNAQSPYFHTSKDDIEKIANIIYYLKKDDIIIRVGYIQGMDKPAYIHYREE